MQHVQNFSGGIVPLSSTVLTCGTGSSCCQHFKNPLTATGLKKNFTDQDTEGMYVLGSCHRLIGTPTSQHILAANYTYPPPLSLMLAKGPGVLTEMAQALLGQETFTAC